MPAKPGDISPAQAEKISRLTEVIVCPRCRGNLSWLDRRSALLCQRCCLLYRTQQGIPVMIVAEAEIYG